jgi:hypothetical protein
MAREGDFTTKDIRKPDDKQEQKHCNKRCTIKNELYRDYADSRQTSNMLFARLDSTPSQQPKEQRPCDTKSRLSVIL